MQALARDVAAIRVGWRVAAATLAQPGSLERALTELGAPDPLVCPFFMSDGWFVSQEMPRRLALAGADGWRVTRPLGMAPALTGLTLRAALEGCAAQGLEPEDVTLLIAGHGSPSDPRPKRVVEDVARSIARDGGFRAVRTGYVDERPYLADAARIDGPAVCLPYFAGRAGHVETDLPEALEAAGFSGPLLDPIGAHRAIPGVVANILADEARERAA